MERRKISRVASGLLLCLAGLLLLNGHQIFLGLPAFLVGIYLMNGLPWKGRRRK